MSSKPQEHHVDKVQAAGQTKPAPPPPKAAAHAAAPAAKAAAAPRDAFHASPDLKEQHQGSPSQLKIPSLIQGNERKGLQNWYSHLNGADKQFYSNYLNKNVAHNASSQSTALRMMSKIDDKGITSQQQKNALRTDVLNGAKQLSPSDASKLGQIQLTSKGPAASSDAQKKNLSFSTGLLKMQKSGQDQAVNQQIDRMQTARQQRLSTPTATPAHAPVNGNTPAQAKTPQASAQVSPKPPAQRPGAPQFPPPPRQMRASQPQAKPPAAPPHQSQPAGKAPATPPHQPQPATKAPAAPPHHPTAKPQSPALPLPSDLQGSARKSAQQWYNKLSSPDKKFYSNYLQKQPPQNRSTALNLAQRINDSNVHNQQQKDALRTAVLNNGQQALTAAQASNLNTIYLTDGKTPQQGGFGSSVHGAGQLNSSQVGKQVAVYNYDKKNLLFDTSLLNMKGAQQSEVVNHEFDHSQLGYELSTKSGLAGKDSIVTGQDVNAAWHQATTQKAQTVQGLTQQFQAKGYTQSQAVSKADNALKSKQELYSTYKSLYTTDNTQQKQQLQHVNSSLGSLVQGQQTGKVQNDQQYLQHFNLNSYARQNNLSQKQVAQFQGWQNNSKKRDSLMSYLASQAGAQGQYNMGTQASGTARNWANQQQHQSGGSASGHAATRAPEAVHTVDKVNLGSRGTSSPNPTPAGPSQATASAVGKSGPAVSQSGPAVSQSGASIRQSTPGTAASGGVSGTSASGGVSGAAASGGVSGPPASGGVSGTPVSGGVPGTPASGGVSGTPASGGVSGPPSPSFSLPGQSAAAPVGSRVPTSSSAPPTLNGGPRWSDPAAAPATSGATGAPATAAAPSSASVGPTNSSPIPLPGQSGATSTSPIPLPGAGSTSRATGPVDSFQSSQVSPSGYSPSITGGGSTAQPVSGTSQPMAAPVDSFQPSGGNAATYLPAATVGGSSGLPGLGTTASSPIPLPGQGATMPQQATINPNAGPVALPGESLASPLSMPVDPSLAQGLPATALNAPVNMQSLTQAWNSAVNVTSPTAGNTNTTNDLVQLASVASSPNGGSAVGNVLDSLVAGPNGADRMANLFDQGALNPRSSEALAATLAHVADAAPDQAVGMMLLTSDNPRGSQSIANFFDAAAADPRAGLGLATFFERATRQPDAARGMGELLNSLTAPGPNGERDMATQMARAFDNGSSWVGGSKLISQGFVNTLDAEGGARNFATLMGRFSSTKDGAESAGNMLLNMSHDDAGAADTAKMLARSTNSRSGATQMLDALNRMADAKGGSDKVSRLFENIASQPDASKLVANSVKDSSNAERFATLLNKMADDPSSARRMMSALYSMEDNPQASQSMQVLRARAGLTPTLQDALQNVESAARAPRPSSAQQQMPLQWRAVSAMADAGLLKSPSNTDAAPAAPPAPKPVSTKPQTASEATPAGHAEQPQSQVPQTKALINMIAASNNEVTASMHSPARLDNPQIANQARNASQPPPSGAPQHGTSEKDRNPLLLYAFRPGDVYGEDTLRQAHVCPNCGFRITLQGDCVRCEAYQRNDQLQTSGVS